MDDKAGAFQAVVKIGRTHLMDAVPLIVGAGDWGAGAVLRRLAQGIIGRAAERLYRARAWSGAAVGTGLNSPSGYRRAGRVPGGAVGQPARSSAPTQQFDAMATRPDALVLAHGGAPGP